MRDHYDVVIIGAGNAGQAAAVVREAGKSVLVVDRRDFGGSLHFKAATSSARPSLRDPARDELDLLRRQRRQTEGHAAHVAARTSGDFIVAGEQGSDESRGSISQGLENAVALALRIEQPRGNAGVTR